MKYGPEWYLIIGNALLIFAITIVVIVAGSYIVFRSLLS